MGCFVKKVAGIFESGAVDDETTVLDRYSRQESRVVKDSVLDDDSDLAEKIQNDARRISHDRILHRQK